MQARRVKKQTPGACAGVRVTADDASRWGNLLGDAQLPSESL